MPEANRPDARSEVVPVLAMGVLFLVSIALAAAIAPTFAANDLQAFEDPENLANPAIYLGIVIVFTLVILLIARLKLKRVIQYVILGAVFLTMVYVFWPLLGLVLPETYAMALGVGAAVALTATLYYYPEWWVVDTAGVVVSAGAGAIFGISFGLLPSLALLVGFAVYDAIAVYRTKHMLDLADSVLELRLPIMFVVPRSKGYSFLKEKGLKAREGSAGEGGGKREGSAGEGEGKREGSAGEGGGRDAMFMGLGDVVIPCVLVVSALTFLDPAIAVGPFGGNALVALATVLGTLVGYGVLMAMVLKGNAHAGLPSLNGGAIAGFLLALVPLYGFQPLTRSFCAFVGC